MGGHDRGFAHDQGHQADVADLVHGNLTADARIYEILQISAERMGDLASARERQRLIAELKQLRQEMLLLGEAERHRSWTPHWKQLPPASEA